MNKKIIFVLLLVFLILILICNLHNKSSYEVEKLTRGFIVAKSNDGALISWRSLKNDSNNTGFELYKNNNLLKTFSNVDSTNYFDSNYEEEDKYLLKVINNKTKKEDVIPEIVFDNINSGISGAYIDIPLDVPKNQIMPNGEVVTYSPNNGVVYDGDNDGIYEYIVKWDPSNSKDNAISGYTGNVFIDCYKLDGKRMWRIDMGINIRAGASYTQVLVYDYDQDNKGEVILRTADGTVDNYGNVVGNKNVDNRNQDGFIVEGK